jgi:hypothetical protein
MTQFTGKYGEKRSKINNQWANGKLTEVLKQKGYHEEYQK